MRFEVQDRLRKLCVVDSHFSIQEADGNVAIRTLSQSHNHAVAAFALGRPVVDRVDQIEVGDAPDTELPVASARQHL
jgi:hypothetical protein